MNKLEAANILNELREQNEFSRIQLENDALKIAIGELYFGHWRFLGKPNYMLPIWCDVCHEPNLIQAEECDYDAEYGITTYTAKCPHCGRKYEWNNCYWR